jgi:exodeoxyribonuclease VII large subunit
LIGNLTGELHGAIREGITARFTQVKASLQHLTRLVQTRLAHEQQSLAHRRALLEKVSPYAAFARGFAFVKDEKGKTVTAAKEVKKDDPLQLHWADGEVRVRVV